MHSGHLDTRRKEGRGWRIGVPPSTPRVRAAQPPGRLLSHGLESRVSINTPFQPLPLGPDP